MLARFTGAGGLESAPGREQCVQAKIGFERGLESQRRAGSERARVAHQPRKRAGGQQGRWAGRQAGSGLRPTW